MLKNKPGVFAAGEMLDWEAPTGGYLLQASFATGVAAGEGSLAFLEQATPPKIKKGCPHGAALPLSDRSPYFGPGATLGHADSRRGGNPGHECRRLRR